ncbi:TAXI family TRAP transporter solute-binding subunit [Rhizobacter sp. Root404]|uniref:TAXI family TRAP transporter solute-binding subunit n=1 Tax=Rhizobacter sp. Root404 TaxID=1736528 RepID=UPI0006F1DCC2|nr:TAXI family TRAP transporter solute-binding subunit [Rhizobacter sp. Root404]KQW36014.1 C4-dicarboxylate ABC transporter substrate-binding protein [Rhizobacter sp. Root404]
MPATLRHTLLSFRDLLATFGPFIVLAAALLVLAYWILDPTPPRKVVLATGTEQGAYAEFGKRYAQILKTYGITVELRPTQGAAENLRLLQDPASGVDIAFMQGGAGEHLRKEADSLAPADEGDDDPTLVSLGSLFYEPVWLFYRTDAAARLLKAPALSSLSQLPGWRLNVGANGSGAPNLMNKLFEANRIDPKALTLVRKSQTPAAVDLIGGDVDALVFASAPESLMVQMLLQTPGIGLYDFAQADAYSRRFPFLTPVTLPRGVVDLAGDLPPRDVRLLAPTATLLARATTHPALLQLFMQAAQQIHGGAGWFQHKGDFPKAGGTEQPLAKEAQRFYANGIPVLQRYLPFWLANLVDRMWPVLVSIIAILIPLSRMLPPLYQFRIRSRIFRWYAQLREVEEAVGKRPADQLLAELGEIESRVEEVHVPLSYADELYSLRSHIQMVGNRLRMADSPVGEAA